MCRQESFLGLGYTKILKDFEKVFIFLKMVKFEPLNVIHADRS